jgi:hypothetical protein
LLGERLARLRFSIYGRAKPANRVTGAPNKPLRESLPGRFAWAKTDAALRDLIEYAAPFCRNPRLARLKRRCASELICLVFCRRSGVAGLF